MDSMVGMMFVVAMFCGVFVIFLAMRQRSETLERQHRERMAMIERGQIPLAEPPAQRRHAASSRSMSLGIIVVGLGLGLMTVISVAAGAPDVGIGIGGAIVILGGSFIARSLLVRPGQESQNSSVPPSHPPSTL